LIDPLRALCRWSEKHLPELQANRARAKAKAVSAGADRDY
jgi:DNA-binding HxlR family transcriptional regulator